MAKIELLRRKANAAAATEWLRLLNGDNLYAKPLERRGELTSPPGRAGQYHALDTGLAQAGDLMGNKWPPANLYQRLRFSLRRFAEALGLATSEDDRFAGCHSACGSEFLVSVGVVLQ
jgi:hypothetical protein